MYHSMNFIPESQALFNNDKTKLNGINTWDDWHLMPSSRPLINPPKLKSQYIDIPGANGSIDATSLLSGNPAYSNREGSFEFYVINGYGEWENRYSDIMDYLHGQRMKIVLEDDKYYYYEGRLTVNAWRSEKDWSKIVIDYNTDPFKYELFSSFDEWLWDPFSFVNGVIRNGYEDIELGEGHDTSYILYVAAGTYPAVPTFYVRSNKPAGDGNYLRIKMHSSTNDTIISTHTIVPTDTLEHTYTYYDQIPTASAVTKFTLECPSTSLFNVSILYKGGRL